MCVNQMKSHANIVVMRGISSVGGKTQANGQTERSHTGAVSLADAEEHELPISHHSALRAQGSGGAAEPVLASRCPPHGLHYRGINCYYSSIRSPSSYLLGGAYESHERDIFISSTVYSAS